MKKLRPRGYVLIAIIIITLSLGLVWFLSLAFPTEKNMKNNNLTTSNKKLPNQLAVVTNIWIHDENKLNVLKDNKVKYLFIDVGGTNMNGTFSNSYEDIGHFLEVINEYQRKTGHNFVLLAYSEVRSTEVDITNEEFRKNYIKSYDTLVKMGFDGLLVDIEPVKFEERDSFVNLLYELRSELPQNSLISVYTGHISEVKTDNVWEWDVDFYRRVATAADIISAPGYDTDYTDADVYKTHIKNQIRIISGLNEADFLFAIPSHKEYPELSSIALDAFYEEIIKHPQSNIIGITLFSEWTAKEQDWNNIESYKNKLLEANN